MTENEIADMKIVDSIKLIMKETDMNLYKIVTGSVGHLMSIGFFENLKEMEEASPKDVALGLALYIEWLSLKNLDE